MKIVVISPNQNHMKDIAGALTPAGHEVIAVEGGKSQLRAAAERHHPDLLLADGMCCDTQELAQVEAVTGQYPRMAVILLCSAHTPEYLLHAMRAGVREILPSPPGAEALESAVRRIAAKMGAAPAKTGSVIAFLPTKGGSGATFLAANLGWELARERRVLLLDLNLQFGDAVSFVHDGKPAATVATVAANIDRLDGALLGASAVKVAPGFSVLAAPEDPGEALEVQPEHVDAILGVAVRHYDFVLVDLGRAIDTATIKVLDRATRVMPVLQPTFPGVRHAAKLRQVFASLGYPQQKVQFVVNRCSRGAEIQPEQVQRALGGVPVLSLPEAGREVTNSIDQGEPLVQASPNHPLARQITTLARELDPRPEEQKNLLARIFRRA